MSPFGAGFGFSQRALQCSEAVIGDRRRRVRSGLGPGVEVDGTQPGASGADTAFRLWPTVFPRADTRYSRRRILPPYVNALLRQVHLLKYCLEAWIAVEAIEQQVDFNL